MKKLWEVIKVAFGIRQEPKKHKRKARYRIVQAADEHFQEECRKTRQLMLNGQD